MRTVSYGSFCRKIAHGLILLLLGSSLCYANAYETIIITAGSCRCPQSYGCPEDCKTTCAAACGCLKQPTFNRLFVCSRQACECVCAPVERYQSKGLF